MLCLSAQTLHYSEQTPSTESQQESQVFSSFALSQFPRVTLCCKSIFYFPCNFVLLLKEDHCLSHTRLTHEYLSSTSHVFLKIFKGRIKICRHAARNIF